MEARSLDTAGIVRRHETASAFDDRVAEASIGVGLTAEMDARG